MIGDTRHGAVFVVGITAKEHIIPNDGLKSVFFTEGFHKG